MSLSDASIKALKPKAATYAVTDEKGLSLQVTSTGSKLWRFRYQFGGKPRLMSLGSYPEVPLAEARRKRDSARNSVHSGIDPVAEKKKAKLLSTLAAANTFSAIAEEYIVTKLVSENRAAITIDKARWLLGHLAPIASLPVTEIKPQEQYAALKRLEGSGKHETARRCRSFSSRVFRYAVVTGRAETDPAAMLSGALITPKVKHHAAPIDPAKVGDVFARHRCLLDRRFDHPPCPANRPACYDAPRRVAAGAMGGIRPRRRYLAHPSRADESAPPPCHPVVAPSRRLSARSL